MQTNCSTSVLEVRQASLGAINSWLWMAVDLFGSKKPIGHIAWAGAEAASGIRCVAFARTFVSACYG